jgi:hypothetical protein
VKDPRNVLVLVPQWAIWSDDERARYLKTRWHPKEEVVVQRKKITERVVVGYARVKLDKWFSKPDREYECLRQGTVLEVLEPDMRDQQDMERQVKMDRRQLVVLRWQKRAILLFGSDIERVGRADWTGQQHGNSGVGEKSAS